MENEKGIPLLVGIGVWTLVGLAVLLSGQHEIKDQANNQDMIVYAMEVTESLCEISDDVSDDKKTQTKDMNECPEDIVPDTITLRVNYDLVSKSKWGDREHILMPDGSNNARCYMGNRYWQDEDYLYCENLLYYGDEGRYLVTVALDTDEDENRDPYLIEYEVKEMDCLLR